MVVEVGDALEEVQPRADGDRRLVGLVAEERVKERVHRLDDLLAADGSENQGDYPAAANASAFDSSGITGMD